MTRPCPITADRDEWRGAVTQADRDAAAELLGFKDWEDAMDYRNPGRIIDGVNRTAQAFARHRRAIELYEEGFGK